MKGLTTAAVVLFVTVYALVYFGLRAGFAITDKLVAAPAQTQIGGK